MPKLHGCCKDNESKTKATLPSVALDECCFHHIELCLENQRSTCEYFYCKRCIMSVSVATFTIQGCVNFDVHNTYFIAS